MSQWVNLFFLDNPIYKYYLDQSCFDQDQKRLLDPIKEVIEYLWSHRAAFLPFCRNLWKFQGEGVWTPHTQDGKQDCCGSLWACQGCLTDPGLCQGCPEPGLLIDGHMMQKKLWPCAQVSVPTRSFLYFYIYVSFFSRVFCGSWKVEETYCWQQVLAVPAPK